MEEIKVGDIVRISENAREYYNTVPTRREFVVTTIGKEYVEIRLKGTLMPMYYAVPDGFLTKVNPKAKESTEKPNFGKIAIPVEADLTDSFWDAYTADLAQEIVLKIINTANDRRPSALGEYAVAVAKSVVENLKKKEL